MPRLTTASIEQIPDLMAGLDVRILFSRVDTLSAGAWDHATLPDSYWRLYQNDAPGGRLTVGGADLMLESNRVYLIPSGLALASHNTGPLNQFYIHFDALGVPPILFPQPIVVPYSRLYSALVSELGRRVQERGEREMGIQCSLKGVVLDAFGRCLGDPSHGWREGYQRQAGAVRPILPAVQYIHRHLGEQFTNALLAQECHLSEDHFIRRFHQAVGLSPAQYVLRQRVNRAAQRLLFTEDTIERIAAETGFSDRFYFSRVFTRENGTPPARYRRGPRI